MAGQQLAISDQLLAVEAVPCCLCGEMPRVVRVRKGWWNAEHDDCGSEPGVSTVGSANREQAVRAWNRLQRKMALGQVAIMRFK